MLQTKKIILYLLIIGYEQMLIGIFIAISKIE